MRKINNKINNASKKMNQCLVSELSKEEEFVWADTNISLKIKICETSPIISCLYLQETQDDFKKISNC